MIKMINLINSIMNIKSKINKSKNSVVQHLYYMVIPHFSLCNEKGAYIINRWFITCRYQISNEFATAIYRCKNVVYNALRMPKIGKHLKMGWNNTKTKASYNSFLPTLQFLLVNYKEYTSNLMINKTSIYISLLLFY